MLVDAGVVVNRHILHTKPDIHLRKVPTGPLVDLKNLLGADGLVASNVDYAELLRLER